MTRTLSRVWLAGVAAAAIATVALAPAHTAQPHTEQFPEAAPMFNPDAAITGVNIAHDMTCVPIPQTVHYQC